MKCCCECFKDSQIRQIISSENIIGSCDFCGAVEVPVLDIAVENKVTELIVNLIQKYEISDHSDARPLFNVLAEDWDVFTGDTPQIRKLLTEICNGLNEIDRTILNGKVIIPELLDDDYQKEYGVLRGESWQTFCDYIKYKNRFHSIVFNADSFASFLSSTVLQCDVNTTLLRGRICNNQEGFSIMEMYGPPVGKRSAGRINPEGIGVLYLASTEETVLAESRAYTYDYITIGKFRPKHDLRLVNLAAITTMSPFSYEGDIETYAINRRVLKDMAKEIAKPLRKTDTPFEYLPTQYIAEFVKSQGYDGVQYESTIEKNGFNVALFDQNLVECFEVKTYEVTKIKYEKKGLYA